MSGSDGDKPLPASQKKLDEAREKGQVPKSNDFTTALIMGATVGVLLVQAGQITAQAKLLLETAGDLLTGDFTLHAKQLVSLCGHIVLTSCAPMAAAAIGASILASIIATPGLLFAVEPVTPDLNKLNPVEGFKNLFNTSALVEFLKSILKLICLAVILGFLLWQGAKPLALTTLLGLSAVLHVFGHIATAIMLCTTLVFLIVGLADILLQRWIFLRDQRMSHEEMKEERKNTDGNPEVKRERDKLRKEDANTPETGVHQATVIVMDSGLMIMGGFRYVAEETPVPVVVCSGRGISARRQRDQGVRAGIPVIENADLAKKLFVVQVGKIIPPDLYGAVAEAIGQATG